MSKKKSGSQGAVTQFIKDPATHINSLNTIIPQLIAQFGKNSSSATDTIELILNALTAKRIIEERDLS
jgi:hypothetical protein